MPVAQKVMKLTKFRKNKLFHGNCFKVAFQVFLQKNFFQVIHGYLGQTGQGQGRCGSSLCVCGADQCPHGSLWPCSQSRNEKGELFPLLMMELSTIMSSIFKDLLCPTSFPFKGGGGLLNFAYVFSDLHKKVCFRCGQHAHLGQYSRAACALS
jgi:hypothetical protein